LHQLNGYLSENPQIRRSFNTETITKYINTLRALGCKIPNATRRNQFTYQLTQHPFPFEMADAPWQLAERVSDVLGGTPALQQAYQAFLQKMRQAVILRGQAPPASEHVRQEALSPSSVLATQPHLQDERTALLSRLRQFCQDDQMVALTIKAAFAWMAGLEESSFSDGNHYFDNLFSDSSTETGTSSVQWVIPLSVRQEAGMDQLVALHPDSRQRIYLPLDWIESVAQLPRKVDRQSQETMVIFQLSGKLANGYRPYPKEEVLRTVSATDLSQQTDSMIVKGKTDDVPGLVLRLLKYGPQCEVLSPTSVRKAMAAQIKKLQAWVVILGILFLSDMLTGELINRLIRPVLDVL
jgi:predicted DNA-binding transcriptional regulator YafY